MLLRPLALFVLTGAVVSFLRYGMSLWGKVPSLLYELWVIPPCRLRHAPFSNSPGRCGSLRSEPRLGLVHGAAEVALNNQSTVPGC